MKKAGSATDPLWYKDAVIYEVHVRAFYDGNNDGIGDFQGLLEKLDYIQDLGVTCIWILPFFPSPLRDDGYDISDYLNVNPSYGTIEDFQRFLDAAHERGLQVMIELVINHTSDQHPWFQRARQAPAGSPERDFYVWSDTDQKYASARIIFTDTEKSNWTWDPVAQQYFWHRFFSHQPDLNFDNPHVMEEILDVMRFWLDMGVDGLRVDAIPYLVEREGTSCENLPETHVQIKRIRAAIDEQYEGRMVLAEANQWPTDVRPYFGDGDECHMAFHFPLMPRIYMALRQEDRLPITDIMAQTPEIPELCQWGLFLRNHDELTLEMVTADERDYMYLAYSADPRMRINIGIRRRLAPLVDNNRRRIELLNSLLFSFPGTPILYYGDEIGMGDNIYLGDRNGVRTPMQWNSDRNAGFSRAVPAKLFSPVIMDPVWGYEAVNVEAQQTDPSSLMSWMRNMIALRKLFQVFGRGTLEFLSPANRKVLAYVRRFGDEIVLCAANLSRFAQPVQLNLSEFAGMTPVEMLGYVEFPPITKEPYPLTLGPYGFLWLELHVTDVPAQSSAELGGSALALSSLSATEQIFQGDNLALLEQKLLPAFLVRQRWFGSKSETITETKVIDWGKLEDSIFVFVRVTLSGGRSEHYSIPLSLAKGTAASSIREQAADATVASLSINGAEGALFDATFSISFREALPQIMANVTPSPTAGGTIFGRPSGGDSRPNIAGASRRGSAEQSNTSVLYGDQTIIKLFRRPEPGINPDVEIGRFLTERTDFRNIPPFLGSLEYLLEGQEPATLAMAQGLVANEGDGWQWMLEELARLYESSGRATVPDALVQSLPSKLPPQKISILAREHMGISLDAGGMLGKRTAELHLALGSTSDDAAFSPTPITTDYLCSISQGIEDQAESVFDLLKKSLFRLPDDVVDMAVLALSKRKAILKGLGVSSSILDGERIRVHGDYHLGQVLRVRNDFVLLDFEGEPARPLEARRTKHSPLKDVAGMLRSFSYAAYAALMRYTDRRPEAFEGLEPWARLWETSVSATFLEAYFTTLGERFLPEKQDDLQNLLNLFLLEKAIYELRYEINNRPSWVRIPLAGINNLFLEL